MTGFDPVSVERWALAYLNRLSNGGRRGVLMGGSIARGQQWAHSDLESGLLVDAFDPAIAYFNVDSGRGVEIIQLIEPELSQQVKTVENGDVSAVAGWPIQLYRARIVSDPAGLLKRFTTQFDRHLFSPAVMSMKLNRHVSDAASALDRARALITAGQPRAALCEVRCAMNDAILALHWSLGELPRSQNRTDSRLRDLTMRHARPEFYALYREVYDLDTADEVIKRDWPAVKDLVLKIAEGWKARAFFETAVDGTFSWGENGGIIGAYRLCIPLVGHVPFPGCPGKDGIFDDLDQRDWAVENQALLRFLGLECANTKTVSHLAQRIENTIGTLKAR